MSLGPTAPLMLSVAMQALLAGWLVLSTWGASILQLHRGSSSSRSMSPPSLPSAHQPSGDTSLASTVGSVPCSRVRGQSERLAVPTHRYGARA